MSDQLASLVISIGADISNYTQGLQEATEHLSGFSGNLEAMGEKLGELAGEFLAFEGFKHLAEEAIEAAAGIEKTTVALTALTGSASIAAETIEKMEGLAKSEALSFPELLAASQHMTAIGLSLEQIEPALAAAGNAAWALGTNVGDVSSKMEGMALSGMAGARQLKALGLSSEDLGKALGVTADKAKEVFKALDEENRLTALTIAMGKFGDVGKQEADKVAGSWVNVKNAWHGFFVELGNDIQPMTSWLERLASAAADVATRMAQNPMWAGGMTTGGMDSLYGVGPQFGNVTGTMGLKAGRIPENAQTGMLYEGVNKPAIPMGAETGDMAAIQRAKEYADAVRKAQQAEEDSITTYGRAVEALAAVKQAMEYGYATATDLRLAQEGVAKAFADANPGLTKWWTEADQAAFAMRSLARATADIADQKLLNFDAFVLQLTAGNLEAPELTEHVKKLTEGTKALNGMVAMGTGELNYLNDAYKKLGLSMNEVSGAVSSDAIAAFDTIAADATTTAQGLEMAWSKVSGQIQKLAKVDLPAARAEYEKYVDLLKEKGGDSPLVNALKHDMQAFQDSMGQMFSHALFSGKSIGQDIANSLKNVGQQILGHVFQDAIDKLLVEMGINTAAHSLGTSATVAHTGVLSAHLGVLGAHLGAMFAHMGVMIGNTVSVLANTIATIANTIWLAIKSALSFFGFADGGIPPVGVPSIVGENGPELFIPHQMGTIIPNGQLGNWVPGDVARGTGGGLLSAAASTSGSYSSQQSAGGTQYVTFNVKSDNPREVVRQIARYLKTAGGPQFSPAS